jgi:hypothetical protein
LVRDYESSQNAQAIWRELSNDAERSTVAQLNATDLLQYTHTARMENCKGTTLSFILHYQEQIRLYDQLQPPNEQTSDHTKMIYLQNAVYAIEELRSVQTTGSQLALANGTVPTYKDYEALLKSAAIMHQYAYTGKGGTIHSSGQLKWCGNDVNDRSIKIDGGRQRLTMVTSFPLMSGAVCHTSQCTPLQTRNSKSYRTFFG